MSDFSNLPVPAEADKDSMLARKFGPQLLNYFAGKIEKEKSLNFTW